jgi:hypothetical protein
MNTVMAASDERYQHQQQRNVFYSHILLDE